MHNIWLVARHEYRRMVVRRGFLIATAAVPIGIAALLGITFLVVTMTQNNAPIGYVDQADVLDLGLQETLPDPDDRVEIRSYPDQSAAQAALEGEEIQAYFVFPPSYPSTLAIDLYFAEDAPRNELWREFDDWVRANLAAELPPEKRTRLLEGSTIVVEDIDSGRVFREDQAVGFIVPLAVSFLFFFATMASAGYMLRVVTDEKENRTMEIMVTSITPNQLIFGKAAGLLSAALTQLAIYIAAAAVALTIGAARLAFLQQLSVPWSYVALMVVFFLPAYVLISGMMIAIGGMVTEFQQGQQAAGLLNLLFVVPLFVLPLILENPGHWAVSLLTYFPTTSLLTVGLRWNLGGLELWQVAISWLIVAGSAVLMLWAAARVFRVGMLRYGKQLSLSGALSAVRGS